MKITKEDRDAVANMLHDGETPAMMAEAIRAEIQEQTGILESFQAGLAVLETLAR